jgi:hypothetical protein
MRYFQYGVNVKKPHVNFSFLNEIEKRAVKFGEKIKQESFLNKPVFNRQVYSFGF